MNSDIQINATETRDVRVTVSKSEVIKSAKHLSTDPLLQLLKEKYKSSIDMKLADDVEGVWKREVEHYGSHSFTTVETLRDLTQDEQEIMRTFAKLDHLLKGIPEC